MLIKRGNLWSAVFRDRGKKKWITTGTADKREARVIHDELISLHKTGDRKKKIAIMLGQEPKDSKPLLLSQTVKKYAKIHPAFSSGGLRTFKAFMAWYGKPHADISEITVDHALKYLEKYTGKTANTYKGDLSKVWRTLAPYSNIRENIWLRIPNRQKDSVNFRPFSDSEIARIMKTDSRLWKDAGTIALYTGLRKVDILTLKWEQIKRDHIELVPQKTARHCRAVIIPLHEAVKNALMRNKNDTPYVFPSVQSKLAGGGFRRQFSAILKTARVFDTSAGQVGFHSFRTTFITRCEEKGIPRHVVQGIVGHASPAMTEHYSHDHESSKAILSL